ncbi:unnamed protein product, partial [Musa acuminata var. zebrina]
RKSQKKKKQKLFLLLDQQLLSLALRAHETPISPSMMGVSSNMSIERRILDPLLGSPPNSGTSCSFSRQWRRPISSDLAGSAGRRSARLR